MKDLKEVVIVGIGASAGGLEALQSFVKNLPEDSNISYIIAQHLSPTYKSMMVELLQKESKIKILEAKDGIVAAANTGYISPPNKNITIGDGNVIHLTEPYASTYSPKPSVDLLFESLANYKKNKAIGIILSGTGSDGSRGIRAIKAEGGFTIAQEPESAKYDGMPISSINTGNIDLILTPENIGNELIEIIQYPVRMAEKGETEDHQKYNNVYKNILSKLVKETKVDFSLYKSSTIVRRIERRMTTLKITSVIEYNSYLEKNKDEVQELFKDILIGVTSFFRDNEPFLALEKKLKEYFEKKDDKLFRAWTPACSTGEEPYTIAMILLEVLGSRATEFKIQIFASDLDMVAIDCARKGVYPESAIIDIPKRYRNKYFTVKGDQYEIIKPIKEMVIFSKHDITRDPPFLRLDLISCRNLLIYFTSELQKKIFPLFHYSLKSNGILLLGKSESVGQFQNYFRAIDKKWKLYEAIYIGKKETPIVTRNYLSDKYVEPQKKELITIKVPSMNEILLSKIEEFILPSSIVINEMMDIVFVKGKNKYLTRPDGDATDNIFRNVNQILSVELRSLINDAKISKELVKSKFHKIALEPESFKFVRIMVIPIFEELNIPPLFLIFFQDEDLENIQAITLEGSAGDDAKVKLVELELIKTREQLQTVIEELETSNEEMQSMNEELQSSNEELQSSNEELETTNEELQSTNEELQTAYAELRFSYDEKQEQKGELEKLQRNLQKANNLLDESQSLANMASWEWNIISSNMIWSNNFYNLLGLDSSKFVPTYEGLLGMVYHEDKEYVDNSFHNALDGKLIFNISFRLENKSKRLIKVKAIATVIFNEDKKAIKMVGNIVDITKESNLEDTNISFLKFIDLILKEEDAVILCDSNNMIQSINKKALQKLDISIDIEILNTDVLKYIKDLDFTELNIYEDSKKVIVLK